MRTTVNQAMIDISWGRKGKIFLWRKTIRMYVGNLMHMMCKYKELKKFTFFIEGFNDRHGLKSVTWFVCYYCAHGSPAVRVDIVRALGPVWPLMYFLSFYTVGSGSNRLLYRKG